MAEIEAKINYGNLKKLIKAMSSQYSVKVGLLANKGGSDQVSENLDLAGLGAVQEFGATINVTDKMRSFFRYKFGINLKKTTTQIVIPPRSFLTMPLSRTNELKKKLRSHFGNYSIGDIADYITESGDFETLAILLGVSAVEQIQEAFNTGGFGEWPENSPLTIEQKGSAMQLVGRGRENDASGHLRNAITYEVSKNNG